jgi:glycosyltransferase involved in cell wall biosynthesis
MAVDLDEYDDVRRAPAEDGHTVLGWAGTAGGLRYLEALAPVLREVSHRHPIVVRVVSGGAERVCLPGVPVEVRRWNADTALSDMKGFDVGLVPLADTPFEQAKFPFKLLEYLALGVPAISARVGVATTILHNAENGLLVGSTEEWRDAIEQLIGDIELRARFSRHGRQTVADRYTVHRVAPLLLDVLCRA